MKIGLRWRWILPLVLLIFFSPASAQDAVVQTPYTCPTETEFRSETPFTQARVEDWLGFWHPLLQEVADMPEYPFHNISYFVLSSCSLHSERAYIALLVPMIGPDVLTPLLTFELQGNQVTAATRYEFNLIGLPHLSAIARFADRNFNGFPDMVVWVRDIGTMYENPMLLLEWRANGIVDISPPVTDGSPNGLEDIDRDGIPELLDTSFYFIPAQQTASAVVQQLRSWYRWNGVAYEMVAVQVYPFEASPGMVTDYLPGLDDRYVQDSGPYIEDFLTAFSLQQICELVVLDDRAGRPEEELSALLFQILLYHQTWGDVQAGWTAIEPITTVARTCPASEGKRFFFNALDGFASDLDGGG